MHRKLRSSRTTGHFGNHPSTRTSVSGGRARCTRTGARAATLSAWPRPTSRPTSWRTRTPTGTSCLRATPPTCGGRSSACPRSGGGAGTASALRSSTASFFRNARRRRLRTPGMRYGRFQWEVSGYVYLELGEFKTDANHCKCNVQVSILFVIRNQPVKDPGES